MKIGVISDVHGNLVALQAILKYFDELNVDEVIHTGDVVDIGPQSNECLNLLLNRPNTTLLIGNHDRDFALNQATARNLSHVPTEHKEQVFGTINKSLRKVVADFLPYTVRTCGGDKILFVHYALKQGNYSIDNFPFEPILTTPTAQGFDELFGDIGCKAVFFGHKHEPCDIQGKCLYVDVGSVGCHKEPFATGIVIDYDDTIWTYTRVAVPYDMDTVCKQMDGIVAGKYLYDFYFLHKNV